MSAAQKGKKAKVGGDKPHETEVAKERRSGVDALRARLAVEAEIIVHEKMPAKVRLSPCLTLAAPRLSTPRGDCRHVCTSLFAPFVRQHQTLGRMRVQRVSGPRSRVPCSNFRVPGSMFFRVPGSGSKDLGSGFREEFRVWEYGRAYGVDGTFWMLPKLQSSYFPTVSNKKIYQDRGPFFKI